MSDLSVNLAGLPLANPTLTCSGTCGYAFEYADFMDLGRLGAFVTKSITAEERPGNEPARIVETRAGMLNAIGLAITLACLAFSHYVLDLTSPLADNIAANVVGLGLGTAFRFWSYRRWVFPKVPAEPPAVGVNR